MYALQVSGFGREATALHPPLSCPHAGLGDQLPRALTGTPRAQRQPRVKARRLNLGLTSPTLQADVEDSVRQPIEVPGIYYLAREAGT